MNQNNLKVREGERIVVMGASFNPPTLAHLRLDLPVGKPLRILRRRISWLCSGAASSIRSMKLKGMNG